MYSFARATQSQKPTENQFKVPAELDTIRLIDLENLNQAGKIMGVGRGTIWRLLQTGRSKITLALIEGRRIEIMESPE
ncbi:DUF134 domain-containing protein [Candidatus Bathyarchaeota archaeon]|nr:MAG: DUF134 domain-containing protein [Candidatus Bathyarchaeota archaeon]